MTDVFPSGAISLPLLLPLPPVTPTKEESVDTKKTKSTKSTKKRPAEEPAPGAPSKKKASSGKKKGDSSGNDEVDEDAIAEARAAVQSLIQNALASPADQDAKKEDASKSTSDSQLDEKADTSSSRIKLLTGKNWAAAFSSVVEDSSAPVPPASPTSMSADAARRNELSAEERARLNRERNRQHARNTRLRKKAYVDELTRTLREMVNERDEAETKKEKEAQRELEVREVRYRVVEDFLNLRGRNETNEARWATILEDDFSFTLPMTGFRKMVKSDSQAFGLEQTLHGVKNVVADSAMFSHFLQTLNPAVPSVPVTFKYSTDREKFIMDGSLVVLDWTATSVGAVSFSMHQLDPNKPFRTFFSRSSSSHYYSQKDTQLLLKGSLRAKFLPATNKMLSIEMTYDTGLVWQQLRERRGPTTTTTSTPNPLSNSASEGIYEMPRLSLPMFISNHEISSSDSSDAFEENSLAGGFDDFN